MAIVALLPGACHSKPGRVVLGIALTTSTHGAVRLAVREINAAGGIDGVPLETVGLEWSGSLDDYNPTAILQWARRFNDTSDLVAVIGHSDSASTLSAAASYNRDRVPHIVTIATNPAITNIGVWTYRLCLSDAAQGPALAEYAANDWKKRRIAIFFVNDDYGRGLAERFEKRVRELGAEVVRTVIHRNVLRPDDEEMIRLAAEELKRQVLPDLVVLFQRPPAAIWTIRAIRDAGLTVDTLGGDNLAQIAFAQSDPVLTEGIRVAQFFELDSKSPRAARFAAELRTLDGTDADYGRAFAYDAVYLLRDAVVGGHYTRAGVKAYLDRLIRERVPIQGVGGTFTLGSDHDARRSLYIAEIHNQQFRVIKSLAVK
jgi:branched-chain amino acid transport system substrate-binding protein